MIRRVFPYVPLGCGAWVSMGMGFVLVFVILLPFTEFVGVALISAMILGPFSGWILATVIVYLVLSPGERRRSREFHGSQKHLREERGGKK